MKVKYIEPSSPSRHAVELVGLVQGRTVDCPVLFAYIDCGLDHCLTFASVKCTLIAIS